MTVRSRTSCGERRWFIDIRYRNPDGTKARFRKDATVQSLTAARAEDHRRLALLATTGKPYEHAEAPQVADVPRTKAVGASKASVPTFRELAKSYLAEFAPSHLKASTQKGYRKVIEAHLVPTLRDIRVDQIGAEDIRRLDTKLVQRKCRASTRRNAQAVLRSILFRYGEERGLAITFRPPRLPRVGVTVSSTLTGDEVRRLFAVCTRDERIAFLLAAYAGLRAGEIRGLRRRDVNLETGMLVVRRSICAGETGAPKSGHQRLVPLVVELRDAIGATSGKLDDAVTSGPRRPWTDTSLTKAFKLAAGRAGLEGWRLHDLRHFFVTSCFRAGLPAPLVQRLAGHEHLATTQRYAHLVELDVANVATRLEALGWGNGGAMASAKLPKPP